MNITQLSTHHYQLTQLGLVNAYLVAEDDGFTLIDTCMRQANPIHEAALRLDKPIRRISLTHAHTNRRRRQLYLVVSARLNTPVAAQRNKLPVQLRRRGHAEGK